MFLLSVATCSQFVVVHIILVTLQFCRLQLLTLQAFGSVKRCDAQHCQKPLQLCECTVLISTVHIRLFRVDPECLMQRTIACRIDSDITGSLSVLYPMWYSYLAFRIRLSTPRGIFAISYCWILLDPAIVADTVLDSAFQIAGDRFRVFQYGISKEHCYCISQR